VPAELVKMEEMPDEILEVVVAAVCQEGICRVYTVGGKWNGPEQA